MALDPRTIDLIKQFEGCRLTAYLDPVGVLTIGWGYTNNAGYGPGVTVGETWTQTQADTIFEDGVLVFRGQVLALLKRAAKANELGAMTSLAYNIGADVFSRSTCLKRFNAGDTEGAAEALTWFNKADGKVMRGLVRRREAERGLFLGEAHPETHDGPVDEHSASVDEPNRAKSKTLGAASVAAVAGGTGTAISAASGIAPVAQYMLIAIFGVIVLAALFIFRERLKKAF